MQSIKINLFDVFLYFKDEIFCNCVSEMKDKISLCISVYFCNF